MTRMRDPLTPETEAQSRRERDPCDPDALLQLSRRADFRFLLPDPRLQVVGYFGPEEGELWRALQRFCDRVVRVELPPRPGLREECDVVVAVEPPRAALRHLRAWLRPGGSLYLEARHALVRRDGWTRSPAHAAAWMRALKRAGLAGVFAYAAWPDIERCAELVPLDDVNALRCALARRRRDWRTRIRVWSVGVLARLGATARLAPHFSLVARRAYTDTDGVA